MATRFFLFDPDGHLMRIPEKLMTELAFGQNTLPQYAGRKIRVAEVYVDHEARKPKAITRAIGVVWHLDEKGSIKADVLDSVRDAMRTLGEATAPPESRAGKVVSIAGKIERKRFDEKHRWELDKDDLDRISATIWPPRGKETPVPIETVQPAAQVRLPLAHEARSAWKACQDAVSKIRYELDGLKVATLRSLVSNLRAEQGPEPIEGALLEGMAIAAEAQLAVAEAYRTGKGIWYAIIEATRTSEHDRYARVDVLTYRTCEGRKAAVAAARELLAQYADQFREDCSIEASVRPAVEWKPEDWMIGPAEEG